MITAFTIARRLPAADQRLRELVVGSTQPAESTKPLDGLASEIARLEAEEEQLKRVLELRSRVANLRVEVALLGERGDELHIIIAVVSERMNCPADSILKRCKHVSAAWPRHVVCHLARKLTNLTDTGIGRSLNGRDHGTVANSIKQVAARMQTEPRFKALVEALESECAQRIKTEALKA